MLNFETELDIAGTRRMVKRTTVVPEVVVETRTVIEPTDTPPAPVGRAEPQPVAAAPASQGAGYLSRDPASWSWQDVRDYVVTEIEQRFGTFPRSGTKEYGIFNSFVSRWGEKAGPIAKAAFEIHGGFWRNAPISVNRFTIKSDPYFAAIIAAENLVAEPVKAW